MPWTGSWGDVSTGRYSTFVVADKATFPFRKGAHMYFSQAETLCIHDGFQISWTIDLSLNVTFSVCSVEHVNDDTKVGMLRDAPNGLHQQLWGKGYWPGHGCPLYNTAWDKKEQ